MVRTQIYLTEEENAFLARLGRELGDGKSALIRRAIDEFIARRDSTARLTALRAACGMWASHEDLPDARSLRASFDRF